MSDDVVLRAAGPPDAEGIAAVELRAWHHAYADLLDPRVLAALDPDERTAHWRERLGVPGTVVACVGPQIVGYAAIAAGELTALDVDPPAQGAGLGTRLLADAELRLRDRGPTRVTARVFEGNGLARRFLERHGWSPEGPPSGQGEGDLPPTVTYRRDLP